MPNTAPGAPIARCRRNQDSVRKFASQFRDAQRIPNPAPVAPRKTKNAPSAGSRLRFGFGLSTPAPIDTAAVAINMSRNRCRQGIGSTQAALRPACGFALTAGGGGGGGGGASTTTPLFGHTTYFFVTFAVAVTNRCPTP